MPRLACVDVPVLPLQLLLREHPGWNDSSVAVVEEDRPQARLLYVNEAARRAGVLPGQAFGVALGLARDLHAGVVSATRIRECVSEIAERLRRHSPDIEPDPAGPGVFWVDADGFDRLHPALETWARAIVSDLQAAGFAATIVVGFTRFGTYAVAKSGHGLKVFASPADEDAAMRDVRLRRLDLDPDVRDRLEVLGIRTVGDFLRLPASGLRQRFGDGVYRLHRLAAGDLWHPLQGLPYVEPLTREAELEAPDGDAGRLLFLIKRLLDSLLATLAARQEGLVSLTLHLRLDDHREYSERLRPAAPTLDAVQLIGLVRLRLETLRLTSGVCNLRLSAEGVGIDDEQVRLFRVSQRDPEAAQRAFARLRAEFGEDVVVRAVLREGHLPAAQFTWEPMTALAARLPAPREITPRPLVRRIYPKPTPLPARPRHEPEKWQRLWGPYVVAGGWWRREVERDYYFAETNRGERLWIYYDRLRRRFFLEGTVE